MLIRGGVRQQQKGKKLQQVTLKKRGITAKNFSLATKCHPKKIEMNQTYVLIRKKCQINFKTF